jgi:hypothetical protein
MEPVDNAAALAATWRSIECDAEITFSRKAIDRPRLG